MVTHCFRASLPARQRFIRVQAGLPGHRWSPTRRSVNSTICWRQTRTASEVKELGRHDDICSIGFAQALCGLDRHGPPSALARNVGGEMFQPIGDTTKGQIGDRPRLAAISCGPVCGPAGKLSMVELSAPCRAGLWVSPARSRGGAGRARSDGRGSWLVPRRASALEVPGRDAPPICRGLALRYRTTVPGASP
jgi:hypothetical protein